MSSPEGKDGLLSVFDAVDTGPAAIEASAGTGKTFTIERLLEYLLFKDPPLDVREILTVTFTEKAAGELKMRLRKALLNIQSNDLARLSGYRNRLAGEKEVVNRAAAALQNYENASIVTIHSFCNRILTESGFELNRAFDTDVVSDEILIPGTLQSLIRYRLPFLKSSKNKMISDEKLKLLLQLSEVLNPYKGAKNITALAKNIQAGEIVVPGYYDLHAMTGEEISDRIFLLLDSEAATAGDPKIVSELQCLITGLLLKEIRSVKRKRNLVSYDDMILEVKNAVLADTATQGIVKKLRKFKAVIIDEFQDTDKNQWQIFKTLFLHPGHRLIVVGDPKQSIYGFRGADIQAYRQAVDEILSFRKTHCKEEQPVIQRLTNNYRSTPELTASLNEMLSLRLFAGTPTASNLQVHSKSAAAWKPDDNYKPVVVLQTTQTVADNVREEVAGAVAAEISRLIRSNTEIQTPEDKRPLNASDFCILIQVFSHSVAVEKALRKHGLVSSLYKKDGLFQSKEAVEISYILEAVREPSREANIRRAMLTRFFQPDPFDPYYILNAQTEPVRELISRWHRMASSQQWTGLFYSIIYDSKLTNKGNHTDFDRTITNTEQIFEFLHIQIQKEKLNMEGVTSLLAAMRFQQSDTGKESVIQRKETSDHAVSLMTIHAAKGLEFPVCFALAGIKPLRNSFPEAYHDYLTAGGFPVRCHAVSSAAGKDVEKKVKEQKTEELRRLFYVAYTRARYRLYLVEQKTDSKGMQICELMGKEPHGDYATVLPCSELAGQPVQKPEIPKPEIRTDIPVIRPFGSRLTDLASFSSLIRTANDSNSQEEHLVELDQTGEVYEPLEEDSAAVAVSPVDRYFRGTVAGNMFHSILEQADHRNPAGESNKRIIQTEIEACLKKNPPSASLQPAITHENSFSFVSEIIQNTLNCPVFEHGPLSAFSDSGCLKHEMEFLMKHSERYRIRGFIDLVFYSKGKYYVLDWKSNALEGYSDEQMHESMQSHNYYLQAGIYSAAVFSMIEPDLFREMVSGHSPAGTNKFKKKLENSAFGGAYYAFLRGMKPDGGGVVFISPADALENYIDLRKELS